MPAMPSSDIKREEISLGPAKYNSNRINTMIGNEATTAKIIIKHELAN